MSHETEQDTHPVNYLKCTKMVDGIPVITGWAPDIEAAGRHAGAVGGDVVVHDKHGTEVASFSDPFILTENVRAAREIARELLACSDEVCYAVSPVGNEDLQDS